MRNAAVTPLLAAISGLGCVAVGAFGAHGLNDPHGRALIETGVIYQMFHTLASLGAVHFRAWGGTIARWATLPFFLGIACFCGALYLIGFGVNAPPLLAPIGGVLFLLGWIAMIAAGVQILAKREAI